MHGRPENGANVTETIPEKATLDVVQHQCVKDMRLRHQCAANTNLLFIKGRRITEKSSRHQAFPTSLLIRLGSRIKALAGTKPNDQPLSTCAGV